MSLRAEHLSDLNFDDCCILLIVLPPNLSHILVVNGQPKTLSLPQSYKYLGYQRMLRSGSVSAEDITDPSASLA